MLTWAINKATKIKTVGLCHSVQGTAQQLANDIGYDMSRINFIAAGINHMAFYLKFEDNGKDLYPLVQKVIDDDRVPDWNRVRYEMFKRLGYFVTESSEHFAEYTPWFIKRDRPDLIEKFNIPIDEYIRRCEVQIAGWELTKNTVENPDVPVDREALAEKLSAAGATEMEIGYAGHMMENFDKVEQSHEYGSFIIHSLETGIPRVVYGNVMNEWLDR